MLITAFLNWVHIGQFWEHIVSKRGWRVKVHMDESQQAKQDKRSSCLGSIHFVS